MTLTRAFCLVGLVLAGAISGSAQTIPVEAVSQPDSAARIGHLSCSSADPDQIRCTANVTVRSGNVSALGLSWQLSSPSGLSIARVTFWDHGRSPRQPHLRPGGKVSFQIAFPVPQSQRAGTQVQVQVDFVVPSSGPLWGNPNSPSYVQMMNRRSQLAKTP